jgi:DNA-directed RNA polymerase specialized sigma24 family protein
VDEREKLELYEQLESWAERLAAAVASHSGLSRWRDDIEQEARSALWEAVQSFDGNGSGVGFVKQRVRHRVLNSANRYGRWDSRELTGMFDDLLYDADTNP